MLTSQNIIRATDMDIILAKVRWDQKAFDSLDDNYWTKFREFLHNNNTGIHMDKENITLFIFTKYDTVNKYNGDGILNWLNNHIDQFNYITEFTDFQWGQIHCKYDYQSLQQLIKTDDEKIYKAWMEDLESLVEVRDIIRKKLLKSSSSDDKKQENKQENKQEDKQEQPKKEEKKGFFNKFKK